MRPDSSRVRRRALKIAFAMSCASGLHLTGCLSATRADLAGEPAKAALRAEQEVSQRRVEQALAEESAADEHAGRVELAAAESTSAKADPGDSAPAAKKGFSSYFSNPFKKKDSKSPVDDPFADAQEVKAGKSEAKAPTKTGAATAAKGEHKPAPQSAGSKTAASSAKPDAKSPAGASNVKPAAAKPENKPDAKPAIAEQRPKPDAVPVKTAAATAAAEQPLDADAWFKQQPEAAAAEPSGPAADAIAKTLAEANAASRPFPQAATGPEQKSADLPARAAARPGERVVGPQPPSDWPAVAVTPAAQKDAATPTDLPKKEVPWSAGAERPAALKPAALKPAATAPDQLAERQYRLRVKALLSEAHTSAIRGELHAAYRSALLAEQVAEEHHIAMRDGDENPRDVARDIAAKIWRASNVAEETAPTDLAAPTATEQPAAATEGFPGANAFATWTPLGQLRAVAPAAPAASELPAIRPGAAPGADDWMAHAAPLPAPVAEAAQPTLAKTSKAPRWSAGDAAMQLPAADQSGVKFAIAQTISPDEVLAQGIAPPELQPAPIPPEFEISRLPQLSAATLDVHRPALLAPPALSPAGAPATWSELSQPSAAAISAAPAVRPGGWSWKLLWSGLGLAAAGISIAFGIRVSRKPTVLVPAPALPVAEALPADEVASGRSIQFKRAA